MDEPPLALPSPAADPLGVLTSTAPVVEQGERVWIDLDRVDAVAAELAAQAGAPPAWDDDLHYRDGTYRTAGWVLVLDALNFCFWSEDPDPLERWRVDYRDEVYDGYWALAAALRRAVEEGKPLWDPRYLVALPPSEVARILRPSQIGAPEVPLFAARVANLHELGRGLLDVYDGEEAAAIFVAGAKRSAVRLVQEVVARFPSFNDVAAYRGQQVRFYKRAQILVADLAGAFGGEGLGAFDDLDALTAFADYKVPQVLRRMGVIGYAPELAAKVDARRLIPAGSEEEVEIRAATVWACELLRRALAERGRPLRAFEVDWALWLLGQALPADARPYHRTYTIFY